MEDVNNAETRSGVSRNSWYYLHNNFVNLTLFSNSKFIIKKKADPVSLPVVEL